MTEFNNLSFNKTLAYWNVRQLVESGDVKTAKICLQILGNWFGKREQDIYLSPLYARIVDMEQGGLFDVPEGNSLV